MSIFFLLFFLLFFSFFLGENTSILHVFLFPNLVARLFFALNRDRTDNNGRLEKPQHFAHNRLDGIEEDAIRYVNIPTGEPFVYEFDGDLRPMGEPDEHGFRGRFVGGKSMASGVISYR